MKKPERRSAIVAIGWTNEKVMTEGVNTVYGKDLKKVSLHVLAFVVITGCHRLSFLFDSPLRIYVERTESEESVSLFLHVARAGSSLGQKEDNYG